jgi:FtsH-binding integral membrane protein
MNDDFLIVLIIFAAIFGIVFVIAQARNRERMAMIEKGVNPKDFMTDRRPNSYGILKWALLLVGVGFGLFIGSVLETYTGIPEEPAYFAAALFFGGAGLFAAFMIAKNAEEKGK